MHVHAIVLTCTCMCIWEDPFDLFVLPAFVGADLSFFDVGRYKDGELEGYLVRSGLFLVHRSFRTRSFRSKSGSLCDQTDWVYYK